MYTSMYKLTHEFTLFMHMHARKNEHTHTCVLIYVHALVYKDIHVHMPLHTCMHTKRLTQPHVCDCEYRKKTNVNLNLRYTTSVSTSHASISTCDKNNVYIYP